MGYLSKIEIYAMSNLVYADTGIKGVVLWLSAHWITGEFDVIHGAKIKVVLGSKITAKGLKNSTTVTLTDPPKVIGELPAKIEKKVIDFVNINRSVLLKYWKNKISTREMLENIESL